MDTTRNVVKAVEKRSDDDAAIFVDEEVAKRRKRKLLSKCQSCRSVYRVSIFLGLDTERLDQISVRFLQER